MAESSTLERARREEWPDEDLVRRVLNGDVLLFELLMRRHNQRVYRATRSILRDDAEAEDVMQEAYVRAYEHLAQFEGRAKFSTWLTRIAVNEAIHRATARGKFDPLTHEDSGQEEEAMSTIQQRSPSPELNTSRSEMASILEKAVLALPDAYRSVVMLRDIEEMSTAETAEALTLSESNVKVRLHRAHEMLRDELMSMVGAGSAQAFGFHATRCDRVVAAVMTQVAANRP
ncbi:MAG TPA: RNA polymerase sigma factor [Terracidiphilus sp.]